MRLVFLRRGPASELAGYSLSALRDLVFVIGLSPAYIQSAKADVRWRMQGSFDCGLLRGLRSKILAQDDKPRNCVSIDASGHSAGGPLKPGFGLSGDAHMSQTYSGEES